MGKKNAPSNTYFHPLLAEKVASFVNEQLSAISFSTLISGLDISRDEEKNELSACLIALEEQGRVVKSRDGKEYAAPAQIGLLSGKVIGHREGFGFLNLGVSKKDLFIPNHQMSGLLHGDVILAKEAGQDKKGRKEVKLVRVLASRKDAIVGRFFVEHGMAFIVPDDTRIQHEFIVEHDGKKGARHGQMVVAELIKRPSKRFGPIARVSEVLGDHMAPGMEIDVALRKFDIPHHWPKKIDKELKLIGEEVPEFAKIDRVDLRELPLVTIDGEDARDFDDAVHCEPKKSGGWRLWVAIADVSYYVRMNTALDEEAQNRSTSVYFPEQVVPMLPEPLSNGLCSLNPDVDRLCMVCEMTVSEKGVLSGYQFYPAVMRSHARFTYTKVGKILDGDEALCAQYTEFVPHLRHIHDMYLALKQTRGQRGAIEFETPEPRFIFNAQKKIDNIELVVRNDAHKLIEESMILANVAAARFITKHKAQALFRVHDSPDGEKLNSFVGFLGELGVTFTPGADLEPKHYRELVERIQDRPDKELIQTMLLRSMKQAIYSGDNEGHFGLALSAYAHFTSPIRRYPDLILHRAIKSILVAQKATKGDIGENEYQAEEIDGLGEQTSMAERRADEATRDVCNWLKCEFMQDHVGATYSGVISAVTGFGFFVRIDDLYVEGLVHIGSLGKDYYIYDAAKQRLIGEHSRKVYKLGDQVKINVQGVNLEEKKIDFALVDSESSVDDIRQRSADSESKDEAKPRKSRGSKTQALMEKEAEKGKGQKKSKHKGKRRSNSSGDKPKSKHNKQKGPKKPNKKAAAKIERSSNKKTKKKSRK